MSNNDTKNFRKDFVRVAGIIIKDGKILLMRRVNNGEEYYTFPGGGQEEGETSEETVVRELHEETSIVVQPRKLLYHISWDSGDQNYFYLCEHISGIVSLRKDSEEYQEMQKGKQIYDPVWVDYDTLPSLLLYQLEIRDLLIEDIKSGFDDKTKELRLNEAERRRSL